MRTVPDMFRPGCVCVCVCRYQAELGRMQTACAQLRQDVGTARTDAVSRATQLERLHAEKAAVERRLADARQRAIADKRQLARHLEAIEDDMVQRAAAGDATRASDDAEREDAATVAAEQAAERDAEAAERDRLAAALATAREDAARLREASAVSGTAREAAEREGAELRAAIEEMRAALERAGEQARGKEAEVVDRDERIQHLLRESDRAQATIHEQVQLAANNKVYIYLKKLF